MKINICSSSRDTVEQSYKDKAKEICDYLATTGWDLVWGAGKYGMMGICYDVFSENNRNIYGYTTSTYADQIPLLDKASIELVESTFDLRKRLFYSSDIILVLEGGIGTTAELLNYLEEKQSNDSNKPIIIYNESHCYDDILNIFNKKIEQGLDSEDLLTYFKVVNSFDELKTIIEEYKKTLE